LPALIRSASISDSFGKGPKPNIPFSLYSVTLTPGARKLGHRVGIPMPKLTYIPSFISLAALLTILSLPALSSPFPGMFG